jgi:nitrite reductase/ring-hydroxylating ferredoxin subunit
MAEYFTVGQLNDFAPDEIRAFLVKGYDVAVINLSGKFYAFDNYCTHEGVTFSSGLGLVTHDSVTCMLHGSTYDLKTGAVVGGPAPDPITIYEVRIQGDEVQIGIS